MKLQLKKSETDVILVVFIQDSSSTTGAGLGSLIHTSSIVGGYVKRGGTGVALAVDEDVATEGTYQAPSAAGKVRIGTPANMRTGTYELHFHNDLFTTADYVVITLGGASNMADLPIEIQLTDIDLNSSVIETELAKVPKSDSTVSWNATALAAIQAECEDAVHSITGAVIGTVGSGSTVTNVVLSSIESGGAYDGAQTNSNMWLNAIAIGTGTNNIGITRRVLTWTFSAGNSFTVAALPGAPLSGDTFLIIPATFDVDTTAGAVDLVTANTDVRGTDNALLAASAPTNFDSMLINAGGNVGISWGQVGSADSTVGLTNTTVGITTLNSDMRGTDTAFTAASGRAAVATLDGLNDFDPDNDDVAVVTLVTTTTTNSDMRGTNLAFLAASARAGITADIVSIDGNPISGTGAQLADGFSFWYNVATPAKTMNDAGVAGTGLAAADVWNYDIGSFATADSAGTVLNSAASGGSPPSIE